MVEFLLRLEAAVRDEGVLEAGGELEVPRLGPGRGDRSRHPEVLGRGGGGRVRTGPHGGAWLYCLCTRGTVVLGHLENKIHRFSLLYKCTFLLTQVSLTNKCLFFCFLNLNQVILVTLESGIL